MTALIRKELTSVFCSPAGLVFSFVFLIACGTMLWIFPGSFNIPDAGYSTLEKFFSLAPILLMILVPALTMRLMAEEKRNGTFDLLRSRPAGLSQIWFSKWLSIVFLTTLVILSTVIYIYTLYLLGNPVGNIDLNATFVSYISLMSLSAVFIAAGLFASSITNNQIAAFITAFILNFVIYFGFDLLSTLFSTGSIRVFVASCGLSHRFGQMQKGLIDAGDICIFIFYITLFWLLSLLVLRLNNNEIRKPSIIGTGLILLSIATPLILPSTRFDLTRDKRYTINDYSKNMMKEFAKGNSTPLKINVYLEGDLNFGFQRLRNAAKDLLDELNRYAGYNVKISFIDPTTLPVSREDLPEYMAKQGMPGILLNEVDRNGKLSRQLIYPHAQAILENDTLQIPLLKNISGNTAEENLNASAENLEFQFIDAVRLLTQNEEQHIAFIEGHGELSRAYVYDAEETLAKYYYVNRGQITDDISVLDDFKVVIIAGATRKFTEAEKYVLDQYLMKGGRILWLLDGAYLSLDELAAKGQSPSIKNETNLDDLLFTYGIRIEPNLLQDSQCTQLVVNNGESSDAVTIPWYYAPLLLPSPHNVITKDISDVKAQFAGSISLLNNPAANGEILLTTSRHSRIIPVPETIDFDIEKVQSDPHYFNDAFIPVAASLSGTFRSAFQNRTIPDSIKAYGQKTIENSQTTKMIIAASSGIIRNDIVGQGEQTQVLPMGFDRVSGKQYGNRDFIVNAVNWLANDEDAYLTLRSKNRQLNLLNKKEIYENRSYYATVNTAIPILFVFLIIGVVNFRRKIKYSK